MRRSAFSAWLAFPASSIPSAKASTALKADATRGSDKTANVFLGSELYVEKCNLTKWHLLSDANFRTPESVNKDELPRAHEGIRHWTPKAQSSQQTGSESFANILLSSLFNGVKATPKHAAIIFNLTPFHGNIELECFNLMASKMWTGPKLHTLSATFDAPALGMAKKHVKEGMLKVWKSGSNDTLLGVDPNQNEAYQAEPPVFIGHAKPPQLLVLQSVPGTLQVRLPQQVVDTFKQDPLKRDALTKIVVDLETTFGKPTEKAPDGTDPTPAPAVDVIAAFKGESMTKLEEVDNAMIKAKFPGHESSYSFLLLKGATDSEPNKLFVVAETDNCTITNSAYALAYWKGNWNKSKKEDASKDMICSWKSLTSDLVVMETPKGDSPPQNFVDVVMKLMEDSPAAAGELSISQHKVLDCEHDSEQKLTNAIANPTSYRLEAKDCIVFKPEPLKDVELRHTNAASNFAKSDMEKSPLLVMRWRVKYFETCHEISPRKPLWFFASCMQLGKKGDLQRIL
jgi:hypothetical protein